MMKLVLLSFLIITVNETKADTLNECFRGAERSLADFRVGALDKKAAKPVCEDIIRKNLPSSDFCVLGYGIVYNERTQKILAKDRTQYTFLTGRYPKWDGKIDTLAQASCSHKFKSE